MEVHNVASKCSFDFFQQLKLFTTILQLLSVALNFSTFKPKIEFMNTIGLNEGFLCYCVTNVVYFIHILI